MKTKIEIKFKQKDLIIRKIGMDYKKMIFNDDQKFLINESGNSYLSEEKENYYSIIKNKIDYILLQMDKNLSMIIYNDYLSTKLENWWIYYYSKSTYYRLKNKAMDNFLEWWYA